VINVPKTLMNDDGRPVDDRDVATKRELHDEQEREQRAGDVGGVDEAEAERVVDVVGSRLADRRAHDLDDPEEEGDLRDLVEHLAAEGEAGRWSRRGGHGPEDRANHLAIT
jgi:hypothetical protein